MKTHLLKLILGSLMVSGTVMAVEDPQEQKHIVVGERSLSRTEHAQMQEKRAELSVKMENGEQVDEEVSDEDISKPKLAQKGISKAIYYSTHEGAFHRPIAVSLLGDAVELEDGSIWSISASERYKTLDWMTGDVVIVTPNHTWFSVYDYCLINLNTGASVSVNLSLGPIYNGYYTHWIVAIDYANRELCLEDGSVWRISSLDQANMYKWLPNDTIIIGINDGWFSGSNPNILINVNVNNYAISNCIF